MEKKSHFFDAEMAKNCRIKSNHRDAGFAYEESDPAPSAAVSSSAFSHQSRDHLTFTDSSLSILRFCR
jgi:hypothetical protein